jgi:hypothetical protein
MIIRSPPVSKGVIKYDSGDQIPAFLLQSSHSERKLIKVRRHPRRQQIFQMPRRDSTRWLSFDAALRRGLTVISISRPQFSQDQK